MENLNSYLDRIPKKPLENYKTSWFWRVFPSGMRRRWWLFRLADIIAKNWPVFSAKQGLLVVRMDGIGDMVLFKQSLEHYASTFRVQKKQITILGCKSWESVADKIFGNYKVINIDEHVFARNLFYRFKVSVRVRKLNPKISVCDSYFRRTLMADSLVWVSGAKRTVVSRPFISERTRAEFTYYLSQFTEIIDTGPYPEHETTRHYRFLSLISNITLPVEKTSIFWDANTPFFLEKPYVVINPGSNEYGRRWPIEKYSLLSKTLVSCGYRVVVIGITSEATKEKEKMFETSGVINLIGKTSLPDLMGILQNASGVISNDTGPAHLSIALNTPTVVIIGGGHFGSFVPYPKKTTPQNARFVYQKMDCYHCFWNCHLRKTKLDSFPCIEGITNQMVWNACKEVLPRLN